MLLGLTFINQAVKLALANALKLIFGQCIWISGYTLTKAALSGTELLCLLQDYYFMVYQQHTQT